MTTTNSRFLTRSHVDRRKRAVDVTYVYDLPFTGGQARVRKITLSDRLLIGSLPTALHDRVLDVLAQLNATTNPVDRRTGTLSRNRAAKNLEANENAFNTYCVVGFVEPQLIFAEEERTDPEQVVVTDIDIRDRRQFANDCESADLEVADRFVPFFLEPTERVAAGGSEPVAGPAPERSAGDAGGGGEPDDLSERRSWRPGAEALGGPTG